MTVEIPKCLACGRRPSERLSGRLIDRREAGRSWVEVSQDNCPDACHDAADLGPAAVALLRDMCRRVRIVAEFYPDVEMCEGEPIAAETGWNVLNESLIDADALLASLPVKP